MAESMGGIEGGVRGGLLAGAEGRGRKGGLSIPLPVIVGDISFFFELV